MGMKPLSSAITIGPKATSSQTSMQHTETGSHDLSSSEQTKAVAHLVAANDPVAVTRKVTGLVLTLIPSLKARYSSNSDLLEYTIKGKTDPASVSKAVRHIRQSLAGLPESDIEKQIALMVPLITLPRDMDDKMLSLKSRTLAAELAKYPADIVLRSFDDVKKHATFFPSFAEFYKHIEWRYLPRKYLLDALHKCIPITN